MRNAVTGENYLWPMNGLTVLGTEGYITTVSDLNWQVVQVGDFDGDGRADILWRNNPTGDDYVYFMNGLAVTSEGYIPNAPITWQVMSK